MPSDEGAQPSDSQAGFMAFQREGQESATLSPGNFRSHGTETVKPKHLLTFANGLALVIGLQIGSGIFAAPSQVAQHVASPVSAVSAWLLGGILVWTGASCFIELGLSIPKNGGIQEYLHYCYGDFPAFLFSWMWIVVAKPCAMAMVAMVFSENFCRCLLPAAWLSVTLTKSIAFVGLAALIFINCLGARTGAYVANGFLVLKLFAVFSVALLGTSRFLLGDSKILEVQHADHAQTGERSIWSSIGEYVTAVFGVLFCYGGWETVY